MKQRNLLLAFALLALFLAPGALYFRRLANRKPFGVILFVGSGLVTGQLAAARLFDGGADRRLAIESLPRVALLRTDAADLAVPDAAAACSALACGVKVNLRALSTDPAGQPRATLLELARQRGRATGLVTNARLTDPAPAAFYAHAADCRDRPGLAAQLAVSRLDVTFGGGRADFLPAARPDRRDLAADLAAGGCTPVQADALDAPQPWTNPRLLGLFADGPLAYRDQPAAAPGSGGALQPSLADMVRAAVASLQRRRGGYLLVVDAGLIGQAARANDAEHTLREIIELDRAVAAAAQYAGPRALVLVAGGESTGGLALNGYPLRQDHGVALLGQNGSGLPSLAWATGPAGPSAPAPAAFAAAEAANVADDALAAGVGPGSERLQGFRDNTFIFELVRDQL